MPEGLYFKRLLSFIRAVTACKSEKVGKFRLKSCNIRLFVPNYSACYYEIFDGKPATCFSIYFGIYPLIVMPKYSTKKIYAL